jgi:hypothetical protein
LIKITKTHFYLFYYLSDPWITFIKIILAF